MSSVRSPLRRVRKCRMWIESSCGSEAGCLPASKMSHNHSAGASVHRRICICPKSSKRDKRTTKESMTPQRYTAMAGCHEYDMSFGLTVSAADVWPQEADEVRVQPPCIRPPTLYADLDGHPCSF